MPQSQNTRNQFPDMSGVILASLVAALVMTGLNALKPVHVDDIIWHQYAQQIAVDPLHPFAFTINWGQVCQPAMNVMSPPVLPYLWGLSISLFGDTPALWKLAFFPVNWIFSLAVFDLARRFAPSLGVALGFAICLSPSILPSMNLMQDVPAAAMVLASVALLLRASDNKSQTAAVFAGVFLGLALLTKWSTLPSVGTLFVAALIFAQSKKWALSVPAIGLVLFLGWEAYLISSVGQSHFAYHLGVEGGWSPDKIVDLVKGAVLAPGALAPIIILLGLGAMMRSNALLNFVGLLILAGMALVVLVPTDAGILNPLTNRPLRLDTPVYLILGGLFWLAILISVARALLGGLGRGGPLHSRQTVFWFLFLWAGIELAGYFIFSPFPATRRWILPLVVATLLIAALVNDRISQKGLRRAAAIQIALGFLFAFVDIADAVRLKQTADWTIQAKQTHSIDAPVWFSGAFGYDYYMMQAGAEYSCAGEGLAVGDIYAHQQIMNGPQSFAELDAKIADGSLVQVDERLFPFALPATVTLAGYYIGHRPLERSRDIMARVRLFRVEKEIDNKALHWR